MGASNYIHIEVEKILKETDKALLLQIDGEEHWIPLSQIADSDEYREGDEEVEMSLTEWICNQKGLK